MGRRKKSMFKFSLGVLNAATFKRRMKQKIRYELRKNLAYNITHPVIPSFRKVLRVFFGISWRVPRIPSVLMVVRKYLKQKIKETK